MNTIDLQMTSEQMEDGTYRLVLVIGGLVSDAQMTKIALWVRSSLKENIDKIGTADPASSKLVMEVPH